jgi:ribokinase
MGVLVSGLTNIETTLRVEGFPVVYHPVRYPFFGVESTVSGVGVNVAKALTVLGETVSFLTLTGDDPHHAWVCADLEQSGIACSGVLPLLRETPASVILYDSEGRRQINVDLKEIQETAFPPAVFAAAAARADLFILCNINFSRPFLETARQTGKPVATDVHALSDLHDPYNREFMAAADILFLSHEQLPAPPADFAGQLYREYGSAVIVIGMGADGALLHLGREGRSWRVSSVVTRPVVNTIGAGDALFSCFVHEYARGREALAALQRAVVFASWKIGEKGAASGFADPAQLEELVTRFLPEARPA